MRITLTPNQDSQNSHNPPEVELVVSQHEALVITLNGPHRQLFVDVEQMGRALQALFPDKFRVL